MKKLLVTIALGATIVSTQALAQPEQGEARGWAQRDATRFHLTPEGLRFADTAAELFLR